MKFILHYITFACAAMNFPVISYLQPSLVMLPGNIIFLSLPVLHTLAHLFLVQRTDFAFILL